jgi:hypothetical protein
MTVQTGPDPATHDQFHQNGQLSGTQDTKFPTVSSRGLRSPLTSTIFSQHRSSNFPVFAISVDLGPITGTTCPIVWALGLVQNSVLQFAAENANAHLRSSSSWTKFTSLDAVVNSLSPHPSKAILAAHSQISDFVSDFPNALQGAESLDSKIMRDAAAVSPEFINLVSPDKQLLESTLQSSIRITPWIHPM